MCVCHTTLSFHYNIAFFDNVVSVVEIIAIQCMNVKLLRFVCFYIKINIH